MRPMSKFCTLLLAALLAGPAFAAKGPAGCKSRPAVESHPLTAQAADRLRRAPGTTRLAHPDEFLLRDGRLLVQPAPGAEGALYSPEAFKLRRSQLDEDLRFRHVAAGESFHVLRSLIDDGDAFPTRVPQLLSDLRHRLTGERLGPPSPEAIEKLVARWREANCRLDPQLFQELTAWAGDLARERAGGRWATHPSEGADRVIEPVIEAPLGGDTVKLAPWLWIAQLLDGGGEIARLIDDALAPPPRARPALVEHTPTGPDAIKPTTSDDKPTTTARDAGSPPLEIVPLPDPGLSH
jgi:hypothetical protein